MMNSVIAPSVIGLALISTVAAARPQGTFEARFLPNADKATRNADIVANYSDKVLELALVPEDDCEGDECYESNYTFEKVKSKTDRCGVITTTGVLDYMPVDGPKTEVTLLDYRNDSCSRIVPMGKLTVKHTLFDRIKGKKVVTTEKFTQEFIYQAVYSLDAKVVSSEHFVGANVAVDGRFKTINLSMNDAESGYVAYSFEKSKTVLDEDCGIIRTTAVLDQRYFDGPLVTITINNNKGNICPTFAPLAAYDVNVTRKPARPGDTIFDTFKADDARVIKPVK